MTPRVAPAPRRASSRLAITELGIQRGEQRLASGTVSLVGGGDERRGLAWIVLLAFLRLVTRDGVLRRPLDQAAALAYVDEWIELPVSRIVMPTEAHWGVLRGLLAHAGTAGNLTNDAHLAALALEHNAKICSADHDFLRFAGIQLINPLTA